MSATDTTDVTLGNLDGRRRKRGSILAWMRSRTKMQYGIAASVAMLLVSLVIIWFVLPELVSDEEPASFDKFHALIRSAQNRNAGNFELWYKINILMQCVLIIAALLATILAAITTPNSAERMRKWSVLVTAVTAALASAQSVFHIKENLEVFIRAVEDLNRIEYNYLVARAPYEAQLRANSLDPLPVALLEIQRRHVAEISRVSVSRMRAWASIGQQSTASPPNSGNQSDQNTNATANASREAPN